MSLKSFFLKMIKRKFVYKHYKDVRLNQFFLHEGRKFQKLDSSRGITAVYPSGIRVFHPNDIVISIQY